MKFLEIPQDSPIRTREGMYSFHTFTFSKNLIIDVYLLDIRWFADPQKDVIFGDEQWEWLDNKMKERSHRIPFLFRIEKRKLNRRYPYL